MSWHYLPEGAADSMQAVCSDTLPCAPSRSAPPAGACCCSGRPTASFPDSPSGTTCAPSTGGHGAASLTSSAAASPVRTSAPPAAAPDWMARDPACGWAWPESFARYDPVSHSWRTRQRSLLADSDVYSQTWPRWGSMRDGECFPLRTLEHDTSANASGSWPTPCKTDGMKVCCKTTMERKERGENRPSGAKIGSSLMWFRPSVDRWTKDGWLSPTMHELLMIWPPSWTDLRPLAMDRFQQWRQWHGGF